MDGGTIKLGEIERHFWLTRSVARTLGVSLTRAMAEGRLTPAAYGEMISRCRAAGCDRLCEAWLARQTGAAKVAPGFCAHADLLNGLRETQ